MDPTADERVATGDSIGVELFAPILSLLGLGIAGYLSIMHFGLLLGDASFGAVCGGSEAWDCNTVIASRFGKLLGVPVSVWGIWYYIAATSLSMGLVILRRDDGRPFAIALMASAALGFVFDLYLAWAMVWLGRACPLCLATYGVNIALLLIGWRCTVGSRGPWSLRTLIPDGKALVRATGSDYYREIAKFMLWSLGAVGSLLVLIVFVVVSGHVQSTENVKLAAMLAYLNMTPAQQVKVEGRPFHGPESSPHVLVVFSDFLCSQCKQMSVYLDIVRANHRDSLRVVHLQFPLEDACNPYSKGISHPGACRLAQAAECAHRQGEFWGFHHAVFGDPRGPNVDRIGRYARTAGLDSTAFAACMSDSGSLNEVRAEIEYAHALGVRATPTTFIDGRRVPGLLKPLLLETALERSASRVPDRPPGPSRN